MLSKAQNFTHPFALIIISAVDLPSGFSQDDFNLFSEQFSQNSYKTKQEIDNSVIPFYSIVDRSYRIRTGENKTKEYSDNALAQIAKSITSDLRNQNYDKAFTDLINRLIDVRSWGGMSTAAIVILSIAGAFFATMIACFTCDCIKNKKEQQVRKAFKTYKELKDSGKDFKAFIQETCVICLDPLANPCPHPPPFLAPNMAIPPANSDPEAHLLNASLNEKGEAKINFNNIEAEMNHQPPVYPNTLGQLSPMGQANPMEPAGPVPAGPPLNGPDSESVFLPCGHNFHKACISDHLKVSNKCPICRNEVVIRDYQTFEEPLRVYYHQRYRRWFNAGQIGTMFSNPLRPLRPTGGVRSGGMSHGGFHSGGVSGRW